MAETNISTNGFGLNIYRCTNTESGHVYAVDMQLQNPKLRTILRAEQQPAVLYDTSRPGTSTMWMGKLFEVV